MAYANHTWGYAPLGSISGAGLDEVASLYGMERHPPKPARVEKWQRWKSPIREYIVVGFTKNGECMLKATSENVYYMPPSYMLTEVTAPEWTFLGYAKPDKVEVGQRWRYEGTSWIVVLDNAAREGWHKIIGERGESIYSADARMLVHGEYIGMAEQDQIAAEAARAKNARDKAIRDSAPFADPQPSRDLKAEARRANEEAAKRLIANPPEWAYPKAWTCAVLAAQEYCAKLISLNVQPASLSELLERRGWSLAEALCIVAGDKASDASIQLVSRMDLEASGADVVAQWNGSPKNIGQTVLGIAIDAYARGMGRTSPLMGRPGVKGGRSTCDLGAEYE